MSSPIIRELNLQKHFEFLWNLHSGKDKIQDLMSKHIKMSGVFWGIGSMQLIYNYLNFEQKEQLKEIESVVFEFLKKCEVVIDKEGTMIGYSQNVGQDANIVSTHYAILILLMINKFNELDVDRVSKWISSLQNQDGSFKCDSYLETDIRFTYCALSSLTILNRLNEINLENTLLYLMRCYNPDGAFGGNPCSESHAAYTFCCVSSLALLNSLDLIDINKLVYWLSERQLRCGGFNGRPEKAPDVCYSWWIFSLLFLLGKTDYIDKYSLEEYILSSQDVLDGGISDRPGDIPDVFHTFFGIAALSLIKNDTMLNRINPLFAIPNNSLVKLKLVTN